MQIKSKVYFTVKGGDEQFVEGEGAMAAGDRQTLDLITDHLKIVVLVPAKNRGEPASNMEDLMRDALDREGIKITRVELISH